MKAGPRRFKKISSLMTAIFFAAQQIILFPPAVRASEIQTPAAKNLPALEIPSEIGGIESSVMSRKNAPLIIHVQDAHGNHDAQENIRKILNHLAASEGIGLVLLEGGKGQLSPEVLNIFPDKPGLNIKIAERLEQQAELSGAEVFLLEKYLSEKTISAYGLENAPAYRANREMFQKVLRARSQSENFLQDMDMQIESLAAPHLNPALKNFLREYENYEIGHAGLQTWLQTLKELSRKNLDIHFDDAFYQNKWPMLVRFYRLHKIEPLLDRAKIEEEKTSFAAELEKNAVSEEMLREFLSVLDFPSDKAVTSVASQKIVELLERLASALPENFSFEAYPHLKAFIQFSVFHQELKAADLFAEIELLEAALSDKLARTQTEKKLLALFKDYRMLKKLFALELVRKDYLAILGSQDKLTPPAIVKRFYDLNQNGQVRQIGFDQLELITKLYELALEFYRGAVKRDQLMADNVVKTMRETNQNKAVMVTGGFHAEGMKAYFESKGFSYVLVSPKIQQIGDSQGYINAMLDNEEEIKTSQVANILVEQPVETVLELGGKHFMDRKARIINEAAGEVIKESEGATSEGRESAGRSEARVYEHLKIDMSADGPGQINRERITALNAWLNDDTPRHRALRTQLGSRAVNIAINEFQAEDNTGFMEVSAVLAYKALYEIMELGKTYEKLAQRQVFDQLGEEASLEAGIFQFKKLVRSLAFAARTESQKRKIRAILSRHEFIVPHAFQDVTGEMNHDLFSIGETRALRALYSNEGDISVMRIDGNKPPQDLNAALPVNNLVFSADESTVAALSPGSRARIWNAATGNVIWTSALSFSPEVSRIALSNDGSQLAAINARGNIKLWDIASKRSQKFAERNAPNNNYRSVALAFFPDGKRILSAGNIIQTSGYHESVVGQETRIYDVNTGDLLLSLPAGAEHALHIDGVVISHDGKKIATAAGEGRAVLWDSETGNRLQVLAPVHNAVEWGMAFSSDDALLAKAGGLDLAVWDINNQIDLLSVSATARGVIFGPSMTFTSDGKLIVLSQRLSGPNRVLTILDLDRLQIPDTLARSEIRSNVLVKVIAVVQSWISNIWSWIKSIFSPIYKTQHQANLSVESLEGRDVSSVTPGVLYSTHELSSFKPYSGFDGAVQVTGAGSGVATLAEGTSHVKITDAQTNRETFSQIIFPNYTGPVSFSSGDITGDGVQDIVAGANGGHVKVINGSTGVEAASFYAFPGFNGAINVASGADVDGDGRADIAVNAVGTSHVKVIKIGDGGTVTELRSFFTFEGYNGPIEIDLKEMNGDGRGDLIVAAGVNTHVKAFDLQSMQLAASFISFPGYTGEVQVRGGDFNRDGYGDIAVMPKETSDLKVFGQTGATFTLLAQTFPYPGYKGAANLGSGDVNGDGRSEIYVGSKQFGHAKALVLAETAKTSNLVSYHPNAYALAPAGHGTVTSFNVSGNFITFGYDLRIGAVEDFSKWAGAGITLDHSLNLTFAPLQLTLGAFGTASLNVEIQDNRGIKATVPAKRVDPVSQLYTITSAELLNANPAIDPANITFIGVVVSDLTAGSREAFGSVNVGIKSAIEPNRLFDAEDISKMPRRTVDGSAPIIAGFASTGSQVKIVKEDRDIVGFRYNGELDGYGGISVGYDNPDTPQKETANFSALLDEGLVIGLNSSGANEIFVEFKGDQPGETQSAKLTSVTGRQQQFVLHKDDLLGVGFEGITEMVVLVKGAGQKEVDIHAQLLGTPVIRPVGRSEARAEQKPFLINAADNEKIQALGTVLDKAIWKEIVTNDERPDILEFRGALKAGGGNSISGFMGLMNAAIEMNAPGLVKEKNFLTIISDLNYTAELLDQLLLQDADNYKAGDDLAAKIGSISGMSHISHMVMGALKRGVKERKILKTKYADMVTQLRDTLRQAAADIEKIRTEIAARAEARIDVSNVKVEDLLIAKRIKKILLEDGIPDTDILRTKTVADLLQIWKLGTIGIAEIQGALDQFGWELKSNPAGTLTLTAPFLNPAAHTQPTRVAAAKIIARIQDQLPVEMMRSVGKWLGLDDDADMKSAILNLARSEARVGEIFVNGTRHQGESHENQVLSIQQVLDIAGLKPESVRYVYVTGAETQYIAAAAGFENLKVDFNTEGILFITHDDAVKNAEVSAPVIAGNAEWDSRPLSDLGALSVRAQNALRIVGGITSVGELRQKTPKELLEIRGFGETALQQVRFLLGDHGLALQGESPVSRSEVRGISFVKSGEKWDALEAEQLVRAVLEKRSGKQALETFEDKLLNPPDTTGVRTMSFERVFSDQALSWDTAPDVSAAQRQEQVLDKIEKIIKFSKRRDIPRPLLLFYVRVLEDISEITFFESKRTPLYIAAAEYANQGLFQVMAMHFNDSERWEAASSPFFTNLKYIEYVKKLAAGGSTTAEAILSKVLTPAYIESLKRQADGGVEEAARILDKYFPSSRSEVRSEQKPFVVTASDNEKVWAIGIALDKVIRDEVAFNDARPDIRKFRGHLKAGGENSISGFMGIMAVAIQMEQPGLVKEKTFLDFVSDLNSTADLLDGLLQQDADAYSVSSELEEKIRAISGQSHISHEIMRLFARESEERKILKTKYPDMAAQLRDALRQAAADIDIIRQEIAGRSEVRSGKRTKQILAALTLVTGAGIVGIRYAQNPEAGLRGAAFMDSSPNVHVKRLMSDDGNERARAVRVLIAKKNPNLTVRVLDLLLFKRSSPQEADKKPAIDDSIRKILAVDIDSAEDLLDSDLLEAKTFGVNAIAEYKGAEALPRLKEWIAGDDAEIKLAAIQALGNMKDDRAAEALKMLNERYESVIKPKLRMPSPETWTMLRKWDEGLPAVERVSMEKFAKENAGFTDEAWEIFRSIKKLEKITPPVKKQGEKPILEEVIIDSDVQIFSLPGDFQKFNIDEKLLELIKQSGVKIDPVRDLLPELKAGMSFSGVFAFSKSGDRVVVAVTGTLQFVNKDGVAVIQPYGVALSKTPADPALIRVHDTGALRQTREPAYVGIGFTKEGKLVIETERSGIYIFDDNGKIEAFAREVKKARSEVRAEELVSGKAFKLPKKTQLLVRLDEKPYEGKKIPPYLLFKIIDLRRDVVKMWFPTRDWILSYEDDMNTRLDPRKMVMLKDRTLVMRARDANLREIMPVLKISFQKDEQGEKRLLIVSDNAPVELVLSSANMKTEKLQTQEGLLPFPNPEDYEYEGFTLDKVLRRSDLSLAYIRNEEGNLEAAPGRSEVRFDGKMAVLAVKIVREVFDGLIPAAGFTGLGPQAGAEIYEMIYGARANREVSPWAPLSEERAAQTLGIMGIPAKPQSSSAYVLEPTVAFDEDLLAVMPYVAGKLTPVAVIVETKEQEKIAKALNAQLAKQGMNPVLIAWTIKEVETEIQQFLDNLGGRKAGKPALKALISASSKSLSAETLRKQLSNDYVIVDAMMRQSMIEKVSGVSEKMKAFMLLKSVETSA